MLARIEATRSVQARIHAGLSLAMAGMMAFVGVLFVAAAAAAGLNLVLPAWAACLIVAGAFLLLALAAALVGRSRMKKPVAMAETKRSLKEDARWMKAQLSS